MKYLKQVIGDIHALPDDVWPFTRDTLINILVDAAGALVPLCDFGGFTLAFDAPTLQLRVMDGATPRVAVCLKTEVNQHNTLRTTVTVCASPMVGLTEEQKALVVTMLYQLSDTDPLLN